MTRPIETWLAGMRADRQRPMVRLVVNRDGRTPAYAFDVDEETDLDELAGQIDTMCRNAGFQSYDLHAIGSDGQTIESEKVELTRSGPAPLARRQAPAGHVLAFQMMLEAGRVRSECLAALQAERSLLVDERRELRRLLLRLQELKHVAGHAGCRAGILPAVDPEAFRQTFEAYVRSQCPKDHPYPEEFLHYYGKLPNDDRDGNFTAKRGFPRIEIYSRAHCAIPGEPTTETILLAHEFGHFRSWERQTQTERDRHEEIVQTERALTPSEQHEILAEEETAWTFARRELQLQGFEGWDVFDKYREIGLEGYRRRFGRTSS